MKKKILALAMALSMCMTPMFAYAQEELPSAETLLEMQEEYMNSVSSASAALTFTFSGAMNLSMPGSDGELTDYSSKMSQTGDLTVDMILSPMKLAITGNMTMDIDGSSTEVPYQSYMIASEDGSMFDTYAYAPAADGSSGEWTHTQVDMAKYAEAFGLSSPEEMTNMNLAEILPEGVSLDWTVESTDTDYILSSTLQGKDLMSVLEPVIEESIQTSMEASGMDPASLDTETILPVVEEVLSCFVINFSTTQDKETGALKTVHVDFNDSDLTPLNEMIASLMTAGGEEVSDMSFAMELNDFSIDGAYTYDQVTEIEIPAEALSAPVLDLNEAMSEAMSE